MAKPVASDRLPSHVVNQPFLGLWLTDPPWTIDPRAFVDCNNVIIYTGQVTSNLMGWTDTGVTLDGAVKLIADFPTNNNHLMVLATPKDIYDWHNGSPVFITPIYNIGTVTATGTLLNSSGGTLWNTADGTLGTRNNVMPGDQIIFGNAQENNPALSWFTVVTVNSNTQMLITPNPGVQINQPYTIRKLAQGTGWNWEIFPGAALPLNSDAIFLTNGLDPVVTWDGNAKFAVYQSDMPFTAIAVRKFKNLMIYGGLTANGQALPTSIANSDNGNPLDLANGVAGQYVVSDGPYAINWLGILGNNLMIYMGSMEGGSVVAGTFVGFPTNFVFTEVIRGRGPIARGLVIEFPDRHEFIAADGQYRYNGLYIQNMNTQVWRVVLQNFERSKSDNCFSNIVFKYGIVHLALPLQTDTSNITTAYVECYLEQPQNPLLKPITKRDFPFTAAGQLPHGSLLRYWNESTYTWNLDPNRWDSNSITGAYADQYVGDSTGKLYTLFTSDLQVAAGYQSFATFGHRITANERMRGLVRRIYPFAEYVAAGYNMVVTLSLYDQVGGQIWKTVTGNMPLNYSGNRFTSPFSRGRVAQVEFSTPGPSQPWTLQGWDWDLSTGGER